MNAPTLDLSQADVARWGHSPPPPLQFAVDELVPVGMVTAIVSQGGAGKSLLAQMACTAPPVGLPFLGKATLGGATAGIFCEDPVEVLHLRQLRINEVLGVEMEDLAGRVFIESYAGIDATLWRDGEPTEFFRVVEEQLGRIPDLRLIVIDNAAMVYADNENDRGAVTRFIGALTGLARRLGTAILLVLHTSKSSDDSAVRSASGSTAWINASRSVLRLEQETDDAPPKLRLIKANHTKPGAEIELRWTDSGVLVLAEAEASGLMASIEQRTIDREFIEALDQVNAQGRHVTDAANSPRYAPKVLRSVMAGRRSKRQAEDAMNRLFNRGEIVVATVRTGNRHSLNAVVRKPKAGGAPGALDPSPSG